MYKPQKVYHPDRRIKELLSAIAAWYNLSEKQQDSIYEKYLEKK